jgi:acyl carrier protein
MDRKEIIERLKPIIKTYAPAQVKDKLEGLTEDADFIQDLYINSANLVDIILDVEEEFNITIDNESMEKMLTVKASIDIILSKLAEK